MRRTSNPARDIGLLPLLAAAAHAVAPERPPGLLRGRTVAPTTAVPEVPFPDPHPAAWAFVPVSEARLAGRLPVCRS